MLNTMVKLFLWGSTFINQNPSEQKSQNVGHKIIIKKKYMPQVLRILQAGCRGFVHIPDIGTIPCYT